MKYIDNNGPPPQQRVDNGMAQQATPESQQQQQEQEPDVRWQNPLKHGLTGMFRVLPNEDPEEYQEFVEMYTYEMAPVGVIETDMAVRIAQETWRMKRADAYEVDMVPQIGVGDELLHVLNLVALYRNRIQRLIDRTWLALRRAQDERRAGLRPAIDNRNLWNAASQTQTGPGYQQGIPWDSEDADRYQVKMADVAAACGGFPPSEQPQAAGSESPESPQ